MANKFVEKRLKKLRDSDSLKAVRVDALLKEEKGYIEEKTPFSVVEVAESNGYVICK